ncbi:L-2-hydroxyglutarate oxidase [Pelagicoccus mobilis]|uniref:L-2-hydroxyglutarate oxidase n=1 Tax=Pelagicoccus mobilis TaxID=415221 RepID=A0A934S1Z7_9BACT|nr:L-2-hydroxyglutarate oxidase [Pelagicoccus mobilis]MBK1877959.1 L-2-hydroxyglutarate oxidase [Pelagicoccus mobilis]
MQTQTVCQKPESNTVEQQTRTRGTRTYDLIVVGGGIVGLATAMKVLEDMPQARVALLEKESSLASHQTGNNSGVIHSGLYYKPGSLKAQHCREGYESLISFCREEGIKHDICGKVVVATEESQLPWLDELLSRGQANGLDGIRKLDADGIREIEPHCAGIKGLFVPQTGIVDYKEVSRKYAERVRSAGGEIRLDTRVVAIERSSNGLIEIASENETFSSKLLVACGGLHADRLAMLTERDLPLRITPFRGEYYTLKKSAYSLVNNLIYPVPDPAFPFLGVHFTRMIHGGVECGPNAVFAFAREGYRKTDISLRDTWSALSWPGFRKVAGKYWRTGLGEFYRSFSKSAFVHALQRLVPEITEDCLEPGGAGVRAQACSVEGQLIDDFSIMESKGVIHVCNSPSPAATASISIGASIAKMAERQLS